MNQPLSKHQIETLPVHDAELFSFHSSTSDDGDTDFEMLIEINFEESLSEFEKLGLTSRVLTIRFENCVQLSIDFMSYQTQREWIDDWEVFTESELIHKHAKHGFVKKGLLHHNFTLTGGSIIKVVAESVSLTPTSK